MTSIAKVKCMGKCMGFAIGPVMSQATPAVHGLIGFLNFIFFAIKQAKMDFVFKLSFFSSSCDQPEFQKKTAKFLIINKAKIESKKKP